MALAQGQRIGDRYTLVSRLGGGGMADVWLADDEMLGRRVALKFLHERYAQDTQFIERFRREAQAAAGLQHPNVVGVYDRGETEGRHWIAMEYVEGASLKDLIARGLTVGEAVEIVRQVLAGDQVRARARDHPSRPQAPQRARRPPRDGRGWSTSASPGRAPRRSPRPARCWAPPSTSRPSRPRASRSTRHLGPLLDRGDPLRGAHRAGPVRGRVAGRGRAQADLRAAAAPVGAQPAGAAGPRRRRPAGPREGPGEPLPDRRRVPRRPRRGRGRPLRRRRAGRRGRGDTAARRRRAPVVEALVGDRARRARAAARRGRGLRAHPPR